MKKIVILASLCLVAAFSVAQKKNVNIALNEAKADKPNYKEAEKLLKEAFENEETKNDARTYFAAGELEFKKFETERNKLYLNQADKVKNEDMYKALKNAFDYYEKAYVLDNQPDAKGKIKPKYSKEILNKIKDNRQFLINGGVYYYEKKSYKEAYFFFNDYVLATEKPMYVSLKIVQDSTLIQIKYYAAIMASQMQDDKLAIDAYSKLKNDNYQSNEVFQALHYLYSQQKDTVNILATLKEGMQKMPKESYYVQNLINIFINKGQFDEAISYLDEAIKIEPSNAQLYNVKGGVLEEQKSNDAALEAYKKAILVDPKNAEAQFNVGRMLYNVSVVKLDEIGKITDQKKYRAEKEALRPLYEEALPYFEKAVELDADKRAYLVPLRNIYYQLNREADYKRVSSILGE